MAHWAKVENGIVTQVNVVEDDFIQANPDRYTGEWIKTSYNSKIRGVYAGVGMTYNETEDIFITVQPFPSWVRVGSFWEARTPMPTTAGMWTWNEETLQWID
jgi:hypothetical protein